MPVCADTLLWWGRKGGEGGGGGRGLRGSVTSEAYFAGGFASGGFNLDELVLGIDPRQTPALGPQGWGFGMGLQPPPGKNHFFRNPDLLF